jgi:outer membrane protein OmpA-like peptidoglycan-associated protein
MNLKRTALTSVSALVLSGAMAGVGYAQSATAQDDAAAATQQQPVKQNATDTSTYATGQPLETQSKEGFWGHMNPFARKKWVHRQIDPVKDRVNELDQVQAKNASDIRDVDSRATAGINRANMAAQQADQHAQDANNRATTANGLATDASGRTDKLHGTVTNLDQYETVSAKDMRFPAGRTVLTKTQKADLDSVAESLANEKGYIVEVQGYSRAGVSQSQAMADSVVRYLVAEHQVPIYRIYRTGLGKTKATVDEGEKPLTNGVRVSVLHNSLASLDGQSANSGSAPAPNQTGQSTPTSY